ncbi:MAG TPA: CBS domain-containing protein [Syntrophomonadaceae bacterium]|nr:CBS domain-containing protein [Syntrophomonadaceae bacterium]
MEAKDIMTTDVITVGPEDKIEDVAQILVEHKISGVPVVDAEGQILGVITEKDLMVRASELKVPFYLTLFDSIIFLENPIRFNNEIKKYTATRVREAMTGKVVVVEEDCPVTKIVEVMQTREINRVPVVKQGNLVGIITRNDILKALVKSNG